MENYTLLYPKDQQHPPIRIGMVRGNTGRGPVWVPDAWGFEEFAESEYDTELVCN